VRGAIAIRQSEQQFLLEAQLRTTAVQLTRNPSMIGKVRCVIAIQQIELHSATWTCQARNQTEYPGNAISTAATPHLVDAMV